MNENNRTNIYSILGLVFGCVAIINIGNIILGILGIVFSSIAKKEDATDKKAQIGFTLSIISLIFASILIIVLALLLIYRVIFIPFE